MQSSNIFVKFFSDHLWLFHLAILVLVLISLHIAVKLIVKIIKTKSKYQWKDKIEYIIIKPALYLIYTLALFYIINTTLKHFKMEDPITILNNIRDVFIVIIVTWIMFRWKNTFEKFLGKKDRKVKVDEVTLDFLSKVFFIVILFVSALIILQILGLNILPLVAFGGVGAAALGLAAKDVISNFFGGLMVYVTRPFKKGDFVELPKEKAIGTIEHIGWYLTAIRTIDKSPIYIPNSLFSTGQIINYSRRSHRKIETTIGVRYKDFDKINDILKSVEKTLEQSSYIDKNLDRYVSLANFGDFSLDIFVRGYISYVSYGEFLKIKQELLIQIYDAIKVTGGDIPFPTSTVQIEKEQ